MAYKLIITKHANSLLNALVRYLLIDKQNKQAATHLLNEMDALYQRLEDNPLQFPLSRDPHLAERYYRIAVTQGMNYVVIYKVTGNTVRIHGFFHGRENYPPKLN